MICRTNVAAVPVEQRPIRVALAGAGQFGRTLISQSRTLDALDIIAVADLDREATARALTDAGLHAEVVEDPVELAGFGCDVLVESTGHPEAAAAAAVAAIDAGLHVVMATKETDSAVGSILAARAGEAGRVYTLVDGDQPSLMVGLVQWARSLGLEVVSAGKGTEDDFIVDLDGGTVRWQGQRTDVPDAASLWQGGDAVALNAARRDALGRFPRTHASDLCEVCLMANATGLMPDVAELHAPILRTLELPDAMRPAADGGLFTDAGRLDVFNCFRRPDELSFAGGVFAVVEWPEGETADVLAAKGIPTSRDGRLGLLHNPLHLLGAEAPASILAAVREGRPTAVPARPVVDQAARAVRPFKTGEQLVMGGHKHEIEGAEAVLVAAAPLAGDTALPFHLAANGVLSRDVAAGEMITGAMIDAPADSVLWALRREQDARWL